MNGRGRFANLPSLVDQEDDPSEATAVAKGYDPKALSHANEANEANANDEAPSNRLSSHDSVPADSGVRVRPRGLVGSATASSPAIPSAPAVPRLYGDEPNEEVTAKLQLSPKERLLGEGWHTLVPRLAVDLRAIVAAHIVRGRACVFLSFVDGETSLGEVAHASGVSRDEAIELVKNLEKRGLLRFS
jgi:hypothetical protein